MSLVQNVVLSWLDILGYVFLSCGLLKEKVNRLMLLYITMCSIITGTLSYTIDSGYISLITGAVIILFLFLLHRRNLVDTLFIYFISTIILVCLQIMMISILDFLINFEKDNFAMALISEVVAVFTVYNIYKKIQLSTFMDYVLSKNKIFFYLLTNLFILASVLLTYWHFNISGFLNNIVFISVLSILMVMINFVVLHNGLKNKFQEEELRIYQRYIPIVEELISEIRSRQHEFDNHIQALSMSLTMEMDGEGLNDETIKYINDIMDNYKIGDLIKLDNKLVAGLLYSKKNQAKEMGIDFEIKIKSYAMESEIRDFELVEVLGILLDNAFESGVEDNKVILELKEEKDMNVIKVMNKHPYLSKEKMGEYLKKGKSTKGRDRGYGLYRLISICRQYGAAIEFDNEIIDNQNYVVFNISFHIK